MQTSKNNNKKFLLRFMKISVKKLQTFDFLCAPLLLPRGEKRGFGNKIHSQKTSALLVIDQITHNGRNTEAHNEKQCA